MTTPTLARTEGRLARAIELADAFSLCVVFGPSGLARDYVAREIATAARSLGEPLTVRYVDAPPSQPPSEARDRRYVLVIDYGDEPPSMREDLGALNRRRDTLRADPMLSLVLVLPTTARAVLAGEAPDLWSVRSTTVVLTTPREATDVEGALHRWAQYCRSAFEARLDAHPSARDRYRHGTYSFAYQLDPLPSPPPLPQLLDAMERVEGWTGWRPWWVPRAKFPPRAIEPATLECWMFSDDQAFPDPAHSDFWRASAEGRFYLLRGYPEDSEPDRIEPGTVHSRSQSIRYAAEALHHAARMAQILSVDASRLHFWAKWEGLLGRRASSWPRDDDWHDEDDAQASSQSEIESFVTTDREEIDRDLATVVARLLRPLNDAFLDEPPPGYIEMYLRELRRGR